MKLLMLYLSLLLLLALSSKAQRPIIDTVPCILIVSDTGQVCTGHYYEIDSSGSLRLADHTEYTRDIWQMRGFEVRSIFMGEYFHLGYLDSRKRQLRFVVWFHKPT